MKDLESSQLHRIKVGDTLTFTDSGWNTITHKELTFDIAGIFEIWITKYNPFTDNILSVVVVNVSVT